MDIQLISLGPQNVSGEVGHAVGECLLYQLNQHFPLHDEVVHGQILNTLGGIHMNIGDAAVIDIKGVVQILVHIAGAEGALRQSLHIVSDGHICAGGDMLCDHGLEVKVHSHIGVRHDHIFFMLIL